VARRSASSICSGSKSRIDRKSFGGFRDEADDDDTGAERVTRARNPDPNWRGAEDGRACLLMAIVLSTFFDFDFYDFYCYFYDFDDVYFYDFALGFDDLLTSGTPH